MNPHTTKPRRINSAAQLSAAGTAVAGIFALQHHAEAAVVYTNPTDIVVSPSFGNNGSALLDINGGGNDFLVAVANYASQAFASMRAADNGRGLLSNASVGLRKLGFGAVISAGAAAGWSSTLFLGFGMRRRAGTVTSGTWLPGSTGFAGVRFDLGIGNFAYGWVRMKVEDTGSNPNAGWPDKVTIYDWAYETSANTPILAGAGGPIPEPSRALLALAGAGAAFLRRRRKQAA